MQRLLLFDNYDSFTFNLFHLVEQFSDVEIEVYRNDEIGLEAISKYDRIILSPGPGLPKDAGILIPLIQEYAASKRILGVCLGLQAMVEAYGGSLKQLDKVMHGLSRKTFVTDSSDPLFHNIPLEFNAGRYHSWIADKNSLPSCFKITATDERNNIMAISHKQYIMHGVQFHPESVLSEHGKQLMENWLKI